MQVTFQKDALIGALKDALRFVPSSTPHLFQRFVLIEADKESDFVALWAAHPDGGICLKIPDQGFGDRAAMIDISGTCALDARILWDIVRKLPGDTVRFTALGTTTTVLAGPVKYDMQGMSPALFPRWTMPAGGVRLHLPAKTLLQMLSCTAYAAAKNEARPVLTGVHLSVCARQLTMEATDSFRLSRVTRTVSSCDHAPVDVVIPADALSRLTALLPDDDDEDVTLHWEPGHVSFTWRDADAQVFLRCLEGTYPRTEHIVPTDFKELFHVPRSAWLQACDRVLTICGRIDCALAQFHFCREHLTLTACSPDIGHVTDCIDGLSGDGEMTLWFNVRSMMDALRSMTSDMVSVQLTGVHTAAVLASGDEEILALLLPLRQRETRAPNHQSA